MDLVITLISPYLYFEMNLLSFTPIYLAIVLSPYLLATGSPTTVNTTLQNFLFPDFHTYSNGFTTAAGISVTNVTTVALSDSALNVIGVQSGLTHTVVTHSGKTAWQANYPNGSYNPSNTPLGGFGFYVNGTTPFTKAIASGASQVMFGYSVMFQQGFEWNMGGKIPGGCESPYYD